ncbi:lactocepin [Isobaculum melis]|uniref:Lactocepin n=2 Tax=Isobaculum melis TaxID=142588 RepID=A0A1H9S601_9LACT|nr:lactocepin [Isobaculum melis]
MIKRRSSFLQNWKSLSMVGLLLITLFVNTTVSVVSATEQEITTTGSHYDEMDQLLTEKMETTDTVSKKALEENIRAQLEARGFDLSELQENEALAEQEFRIIIQLESEAAVNEISAPTGSESSVRKIESATDEVIAEQKDIKKEVEKITGNQVNQSFGYLLNGFSIDAKYADLDKIREIDGVHSVAIAKAYYPTAIDANQLAHVEQVWEKHQLKGEGMIVSIIDSGIDPTHKDLRLSDQTNEKISISEGQTNVNNIGYGKVFSRKIPYGHNYADNNEEIVDKNPAVGMHGMHVAGIVAANGEGDDPAKAVLGVAPEAQLLAMKVFSNNPRIATALDDDIIAAIEDSVKFGADIINMSLGSVSGSMDPNSPDQIAIREAAEAGVLSVISAGNSSLSTTNNPNVDPQNLLGTVDTGTLGAPGVAAEALTVASAENSLITSDGLLLYLEDGMGNKTPHQIESATSPSGAILFSKTVTASHDLLTTTHEMIDVGLGTEADYQGKDVQGKIVLIKRGEIAFSEKQANAKANGAAAAFIYNNIPNNAPISMQLADPNYLTLGLTNEAGAALVALIQQQPSQLVSFEINGYQFSNPSEGKMSAFSSWGPLPNLEFKPEISGPGGQIYSTLNDNGYGTKSGTSMSSPFVAGSTALVYQALKQKQAPLTGIDLIHFTKLSVMNTAIPMLDKEHQNAIISPRRQGAGQIKVDYAIENTTTLTDLVDGDGALALKQIGAVTTFSVQVKNNGAKEVHYQFDDVGGVYTEAQTVSSEVYDQKIEGATLTASEQSITLQPGEEKILEFSLQLPSQFSVNQFVEGYIRLTSDTEPALTMPYLGFYGDYGDAPVIDAPIYEMTSLLGYGYFTDKKNTILGLENNTVNPEKIAISPNADKRQDEAKPTLLFLRNSKSIVYEVTDANKKVLRKLYESKQDRKDYFNANTSNFSSHTITDANWDGTVYQTKTGKNEVVADGQYYLKVTAYAQVEGAKAQETYLPIKVDTTAPEISELAFQNSAGNPTLTMKVKDETSKVDTRTMVVSINGKIDTYEITDQNLDAVKVAISQAHAPRNGVNQVEVLVSDHAGNRGYLNQFVKYGESEALVLFNLVENQVITSNTLDYSEATQTFTIQGSYPINGQPLFVNGLALNPSQGVFKAAIPIDESTEEIIFSTDEAQQEILQEIPIEVHVKKPEFTLFTPSEITSTTNEASVTISGKVDSTIQNLSLENHGTTQILDLTSQIQADGSFNLTIGLANGQNAIEVTAKDAYGNQTIVKRMVTTTSIQQRTIIELENVDRSGITLIGVGNPYVDTENQTYTIKGRLREKVDQFKINQEDVAYDETTLTFEHPIQLKQGKQSVAFYLQAAHLNNGEALVNEGYYLFSDTVLPSLEIADLSIDENGDYQVYTNENPFHLKGLVSDNLSGYKLYINNENVYTDIDYASLDEKFFEGKSAVSFDHPVALTEGENFIQVGLVDSLGNLEKKRITVFLKQAVVQAPVITPSTTDATKQAVHLQATIPEETTVFYSFDGENFEPYTTEIAVSQNQKVYFKAQDKYGNVSELTIYEVQNIQEKIASKPKVTIRAYDAATKSVTAILDYETPLTDAQKAYTHLRYRLDDKKQRTTKDEFVAYEGPIQITQSTVLAVQSYDDAGNESEVIETRIQVHHPVKPTTPETETQNDEKAKETNEKENGVNQASDTTPHANQRQEKATSQNEEETNPSTHKGSLPRTGEQPIVELNLLGLTVGLLALSYLKRSKKVK